MTLPLAATLTANLTLLGFILIAGFGLVLGFFTNTGSGIANHPWEGHLAAPAARLPDEFHQFAARQQLEADMRAAAREEWYREHFPDDDATVDDLNAALAQEASARKAAKAERDAGRTTAR